MTESKPPQTRRTATKATKPEPAVKAPAPTSTPVVEEVVAKPAAKPAKITTEVLFKRRLSQGDHGPAVAEVQRILCLLGEWEGTQDGRYGSLLAKAVRRFQASHEIRPTGEVDIRTWEALTA